MELSLTNLVAALIRKLAYLSENFGPTGEVNTDLAIVLLALLVIFIFLSLRTVARASAAINKRHNDPEFGKNVLGRLEKLEMTLNNLKTDVNRAAHLTKGDYSFLRQELDSIKRHLNLEVTAVSRLSEHEVESPMDAVPPGLDPPSEAEEEPQPPGGGKLSYSLHKTREGILGKIKSLFRGRPKLDSEAVDDLEELLIASDLGVKTTNHLLDQLRGEIEAGDRVDQNFLIAAIKTKVLAILQSDSGLGSAVTFNADISPFVVVVVGVNGVGKTTSVAKLAYQWSKQGKRVLVVAADTFRAAAVEQLSAWCAEVGVPVVSGAADAKPGTVVFDGMRRAQDEKFDVVLIDTAGRLHNKSNLMQELSGVVNSIKRHQTDAPHEVLLVVDGATGQNALAQAREFNQAVKLSGVIVTKLDGTPKGGIVVAIKNELGIPVRYIGVGEAKQDLKPFVAAEFVEALFDQSAPEQVLTAHGKERLAMQQGESR